MVVVEEQEMKAKTKDSAAAVAALDLSQLNDGGIVPKKKGGGTRASRHAARQAARASRLKAKQKGATRSNDDGDGDDDISSLSSSSDDDHLHKPYDHDTGDVDDSFSSASSDDMSALADSDDEDSGSGDHLVYETVSSAREDTGRTTEDHSRSYVFWQHCRFLQTLVLGSHRLLERMHAEFEEEFSFFLVRPSAVASFTHGTLCGH